MDKIVLDEFERVIIPKSLVNYVRVEGNNWKYRGLDKQGNLIYENERDVDAWFW